MKNLSNVQKHFKEKARRYDDRADDARTAALREFYKGRAAEARAAASSLSKFLFDPEQDTYQHEHSK